LQQHGFLLTTQQDKQDQESSKYLYTERQTAAAPAKSGKRVKEQQMGEVFFAVDFLLNIVLSFCLP
jgi:hypothetical protein